MANLMIADGNNDGAITVLSKSVGAPGAVAIPFLDFMLGECKLFRGDTDADMPLKKFLAEHKGKHFIKEAHQKLAWFALLKGDRSGYYNHMQQNPALAIEVFQTMRMLVHGVVEGLGQLAKCFVIITTIVVKPAAK